MLYKNSKKVEGIKFLLLLIIPIIIYVIPVSNIEKNPVPCISRMLFDIECRGCGITRATINLIHFNINKAIEYNSSVLIVLPILILVYCKLIIKQFNNYKKYRNE